MAEVPATPGVVPGVVTSEYKATKIATVVSIVATVVGIATSFMESLQQALPGLKWISIVLTALGMIGTILATLGYQQARAAVKVAAVAASGAAPIIPPAEAAANLGKVP